MNGSLHAPPTDMRRVYTWYKKAQVDYVDVYIRMYISYNAWYQQVTGTSNDRQAITMLKKRFIIWDDYCKGRTLQKLRVYVEHIAKCTDTDPLTGNTLWNGTVVDGDDWKGLIEFWYQVRCRLVHGSEVRQVYVWLAYESLNVFMGEIIDRMQACFTEEDEERLEELTTLVKTEQGKDDRFQRLQQKLQAKYIDSPDIWKVDMQRVF